MIPATTLEDAVQNAESLLHALLKQRTSATAPSSIDGMYALQDRASSPDQQTHYSSELPSRQPTEQPMDRSTPLPTAPNSSSPSSSSFQRTVTTAPPAVLQESVLSLADGAGGEAVGPATGERSSVRIRQGPGGDSDLLTLSPDWSPQFNAWSQAREENDRLPLLLMQQARDFSVPQETRLQKEALYNHTSIGSGSKLSTSLRFDMGSSMERLNKKMRIICERLKKVEKEGGHSVILVQKSDALIQEFAEGQKGDRKLMASLQRELQNLKAQLANGNAESSAAAGINIAAARQMIETRLDEELPKLSHAVQRTCSQAQSKVLRGWTNSMTAAMQHQKNNEQPFSMKEELASMRSKLQSFESKAFGADAKKRDMKLLETCSEEVSASVCSLLEKINEQMAASQREHRNKMSSLEKTQTQLSTNNGVLQQQLANALGQMGRKDKMIRDLSRNLLLAVERIAILEKRLCATDALLAASAFAPAPAPEPALTHFYAPFPTDCAAVSAASKSTNPFNDLNFGGNGMHVHLYLPDDEQENGHDGLDQFTPFDARDDALNASIQTKKMINRALFSPTR